MCSAESYGRQVQTISKHMGVSIKWRYPQIIHLEIFNDICRWIFPCKLSICGVPHYGTTHTKAECFITRSLNSSFAKGTKLRWQEHGFLMASWLFENCCPLEGWNHQNSGHKKLPNQETLLDLLDVDTLLPEPEDPQASTSHWCWSFWCNKSTIGPSPFFSGTLMVTQTYTDIVDWYQAKFGAHRILAAYSRWCPSSWL